MCGACENLLSYREGETVQVVEKTGDPERIGRVAELDRVLGVSVLWEDGTRKWFHYDLWCPLNFDLGFSFVLTDASRFQPTGNSAAAPSAGDALPPPSKRIKFLSAEGRQEQEIRRAAECGACVLPLKGWEGVIVD